MATIYDIAKAANVSPKTVSRVINGEGPVGAKTREKVQKIIDEFGYKPSRAARVMRSGRSGLIGLITGAIGAQDNIFEPSGLPDLLIVKGIQKAIGISSHTLMIADTGGSADQVKPLIETFAQHQVDGLIYVGDYLREIVVPKGRLSSPLLLVNCFDQKHTPAILPNDEDGQYQLVTQMIASGHRRIAYLRLKETTMASQLRLKGYRRALTDAGIAYCADLTAATEHLDRDRETEIIQKYLEFIFALDEPPTAICCGNDRMAMQIYGILRTMGFKVPEQISVAGYDNNLMIAEALFPQLTTASLPYFEMGMRAGEEILAMIQEPNVRRVSPQYIDGKVCWRSSVLNKEKTVQFHRRKK